ncbi:MAG: hypothetical protein MJ252_14285 [archaeon]|nr:hypothetical protein [archaeon]
MSNCPAFESYGGCSKTEATLYWILYAASTILFIITGSVNMAEVESPEGTGKWHRLMTTYLRSGYVGGDIDFTGDKRVVYICFVILLAFTFYVAVIIFLKGTVIKEALLYDMVFGKWARFLSIPILLTGTMCLIPLVYDTLDGSDRNEKAAAVVALIFNLICIGGLIFIYLQMPPCADNYLCLAFKKGFVSSAIAYHIYFFFNNVITIAYFDDPLMKHVDARHTGSWICICLFGAIIGGITWLWNDLIIGLMGFLFQVAFLTMSALDKKKKDFGARLTGNFVCSIIFVIILFCELIALILLKRGEITK